MSDKTIENFFAKQDETVSKAGEMMWQTPAGAHAIKLLAKQKAVTFLSRMAI